MKSVDRANYVLDKRHAYEDSPQYVPAAPYSIVSEHIDTYY
jgi:hypothetical protein